MDSKEKNYIGNNLLKHLKPFKNIIWFLSLFLIFEFIWKICVHQGEDERILLVLGGKDLTIYTEGINRWTAESVYWFVHDILGYKDFYLINGITLYFKGSIPIDIIWGMYRT